MKMFYRSGNILCLMCCLTLLLILSTACSANPLTAQTAPTATPKPSPTATPSPTPSPTPTPAAAASWPTYQAKSFSIKYPQDWVAKAQNQANSSGVEIISPDGNDAIDVLASPNQSAGSADTFKSIYVNNLPSLIGMKNAKKMPAQPDASFAGQTWSYSGYQGSLQNAQVQLISYIAYDSANQNAYAIVDVSANNTDAEQNYFKPMHDSLIIK